MMRVDAAGPAPSALLPDAPLRDRAPNVTPLADRPNVTPLDDVSDAASPRGPAHGGAVDGGDAFARLVDAAGAILDGADRAERAFAAHRGGLQEMVVERARADVALQIAAAAAQRTVQSLSTVLGMQL